MVPCIFYCNLRTQQLSFFKVDNAWNGVGMDSYENSFDLGAKG